MKRMFLLLVFSLVLAAPVATAAAKKCPPKCSHRTRQCAHPAPAPSLWDQVVAGFGLTAGFRWDRECPDGDSFNGIQQPPARPLGNEDPFFVGGELRLPLNTWVDVAGNLDRDFTDAPNWNARVYLSAHPWRK